MLAAVLLSAALLVPGYFLARLVNLNNYLLVFGVVLSCVVFITMAQVARWLALPVWQMTAMYMLLTVVLAAVAVRVRGWRILSDLCNLGTLKDTLFSRSVSGSMVVLVVLLVAAYFLVFGVYDEFPSDLYQRLGYTLDSLEKLERNGFASIARLASNRTFYVLVAWVSWLTGQVPLEVFPAISVVLCFLFLFGVAACADRVYRVFDFSWKFHQVAIFSAVFFTATQMGITGFSFIRYYSFAPSILAMLAYFSGIICLLDVYEDRRSFLRSAILLACAVFASSVLHLQEAVFIGVAALLLGAWYVLVQIVKPDVTVSRRKLVVIITLACVALISILSFYVWIRLNYRMRFPPNTKILEFSFQYIGKIFILNPAYQFYQVLTVWGLLVYLMFLVFFRHFLRQPLLMLGMLSPVVTVFNPIFVDVFMRMGQAITVWRMGYFIPLHLVAGVLVVLLLRQFASPTLARRVAGVAGLAAMLILLLPGIGGVPLNAYARTTLARVEPGNSWRHWEDLVSFLNSENNGILKKEKVVLTDPLTGYLINTLADLRAYQYKFLPNRAYYHHPFSFESYDDFPLADYPGRLLIINLRNGNKSEAGAISGHWSRDILRLTDYYSEALLPHLQAHPELFEELWSSGDIFVYRIR